MSQLKRVVLEMLVVVISVSFSAQATERTVGSGYTTIQSAIDASNEGDVVIVPSGTYYENLVIEDCSITLMSTDPSDPDTVAGTIIDGGGETVKKSVITIKDGGILSVICGLTIQNGRAENPTGTPLVGENPNYCGGGICVTSNLHGVTVSNCVIQNNSANHYGGGLYQVRTVKNSTIINNTARYDACNSSLDGSGGGLAKCGNEISNCIIENNVALFGGGLYDCQSIQKCTIRGNESRVIVINPYSDVLVCGGGFGGGLNKCGQISDCIIADNFIGGSGLENYITDGGGLYNCNSIENCEIIGNQSLHRGGGLARCSYVKRCTITGNLAGSSGGGAWNDSSTNAADFMENCIITDNKANIGGGVCDTRVFGCRITGNEASIYGGGLFFDMENTPDYYSYTQFMVGRCVISGNIANQGGGFAGNIKLANCTIVGNSADEYGAGYGVHLRESGIYSPHADSNISIVNSIIEWNRIAGTNTPSDNINLQDISYSGFPAGGMSGPNNIHVGPAFVKAGVWNDNGTPSDYTDDYWVDGDYHLSGDNGYVDSGYNDLLYGFGDGGRIDYDCEGQKITDSSLWGPNGTAVVDRGAYEVIDGPVLKYIDQASSTSTFFNPYGTLIDDADYVPSDSDSSTQGHTRTALKLDGNGDCVKIDDYYGISGGHERTCMAWIKADPSSVAGIATVMGWGKWQQTKAWYVGINNNGNGTGYLGVGMIGTGKLGSTNLTDGRWHHIAVVVPYKTNPTISDCLLYVDGELEDISYNLYPDNIVDTELVNLAYIGAVDTGNNQPVWFFKGLIDEAWIIDRALTPDAIRTGVLNQWYDGYGFRSASWWSGSNLKPFSDCKVAHWKMDEGLGMSVQDDTANNYHGTLVNFDDEEDGNGGTIHLATAAAHKWAGGVNGKALRFDGVDDYVAVNQYKGVSGYSARTAAAWIKAEPRDDSVPMIFIDWGTEQSVGNWYLGLKRTYGDGGAYFGVGVAGNVCKIGTTNVMDGRWHHVAAVLPQKIDPKISDVCLFVDGKLEETKELWDSTLTINTVTNTPVLIGAYRSYSGLVCNYFKGLIDDISLFDRDLTADEVRGLATEPDELYLKLDSSQLFTDPYGSVSRYTQDSSPENRHAVLTSFPETPSCWVTGFKSGETGLEFSFDLQAQPSKLVYGSGNPNYYGISGSSSRTCTAWIKTGQDGCIMKWGNPSTLWNMTTFTIPGENWVVGIKNGKLYVDIGGASIQGSADIDDAGWHHIAVVFKEDEHPTPEDISFYIDGQEDTSATISDAYRTILNTIAVSMVSIGGNYESIGYNFAGVMDEIRIYNRALTGTQIFELSQ